MPLAKEACKFMSETILQNMLILFNSVDKNTEIVQARMRSAGIQLDPVVAESVAKYWDALEKLAAE